MISMYTGQTPSDERKNIETNSSIILSTYQMAKEGLDIQRLDTLVMATPKSDVEQAIGRIQRPNANKCEPLVIDVVDKNITFTNLRNKRFKYYTKCKYDVNISSSSNI